jgi:hypothetical protein
MLFTGEWILLDRAFPANIPGCVETSPFSCWDVRAPLIALLSLPIWYVVWAISLRPCPWPLRWLTPLAVSLSGYRFAELVDTGAGGVGSTALLVGGYLVAATVMSGVNASVADGGGQRA